MRAPDPDLGLLLDAAHGAGAIARARFKAGGRVWDKGGGQGPVTETDLEVDAFLRDRLLGARPGWGWLSEESTDLADPARLGADTTFVVDPIDGTRAFVDGQPQFAHALAVVRGGKATVAVVHLPMLGLTYAAALGMGARLNDAPIAPSAQTDPTGARVLASRAVMDPAAWAGPAPRMDRHFRPSLAWRLALVAEGAFDAALTLRAAWDWDIAAASLIAQEAGARVTDRQGRALAFNSPSARSDGVIAAPPALHAALLAALSPIPTPTGPLL